MQSRLLVLRGSACALRRGAAVAVARASPVLARPALVRPFSGAPSGGSKSGAASGARPAPPSGEEERDAARAAADAGADGAAAGGGSSGDAGGDSGSAGSSSTGGEGAAAGGGDGGAAPKPKVSRWYKLKEDVKDVLAVTFGMERKRNVALEYDLGLRPYPWVTYTDPSSGTQLYRNKETGMVTDIKPSDFDTRAGKDAFLDVNTDASALTMTAEEKTAFQRAKERVAATPLAAGVAAVGRAVAESPVGSAAAAVKTKVSDIKEDALEKWETSQHPLIVNSAYLVDSLTSETEQARALKEIKQLDAGFDEFFFVAEMRDAYLPRLARAFLRMDITALEGMCGEGALAQARALAAVRSADGLQADGTVLSVSKVEVLQARTVEDPSGGTLPVIVVTGQVQYIHCVRDATGAIREGSESEIRASVLVAGLTRKFNPNTADFTWTTVDFAMHGSQLYL